MWVLSISRSHLQSLVWICCPDYAVQVMLECKTDLLASKVLVVGTVTTFKHTCPSTDTWMVGK